MKLRLNNENKLLERVDQFKLNRLLRFLLQDHRTSFDAAALRNAFYIEVHQVGASKLAIDGLAEQRNIRVPRSSSSPIRVGQIYPGRNGGFRPTDFPLFKDCATPVLANFCFTFTTQLLTNRNRPEADVSAQQLVPNNGTISIRREQHVPQHRVTRLENYKTAFVCHYISGAHNEP